MPRETICFCCYVISKLRSILTSYSLIYHDWQIYEKKQKFKSAMTIYENDVNNVNWCFQGVPLNDVQPRGPQLSSTFPRATYKFVCGVQIRQLFTRSFILGRKLLRSVFPRATCNNSRPTLLSYPRAPRSRSTFIELTCISVLKTIWVSVNHEFKSFLEISLKMVLFFIHNLKGGPGNFVIWRLVGSKRRCFQEWIQRRQPWRKNQ